MSVTETDIANWILL